MFSIFKKSNNPSGSNQDLSLGKCYVAFVDTFPSTKIAKIDIPTWEIVGKLTDKYEIDYGFTKKILLNKDICFSTKEEAKQKAMKLFDIEIEKTETYLAHLKIQKSKL